MTRLLEEIQQYQSKFRQKAPAEKQRLMAEATAELADSGVAQGLGVGDTIPHFTLPDVSGEPVAIETLLEQGPVILTFYRVAGVRTAISSFARTNGRSNGFAHLVQPLLQSVRRHLILLSKRRTRMS